MTLHDIMANYVGNMELHIFDHNDDNTDDETILTDYNAVISIDGSSLKVTLLMTIDNTLCVYVRGEDDPYWREVNR